MKTKLDRRRFFKPVPKITQAVIYCRYSPRPDDSDSCDEQEKLARDYCAKRGWNVAGVFRDEKVSGKRFKRPNLWEAIQMLRKGWVLVVRDQERIARRAILQFTIEEAVEKVRARIEYIWGINGDSDDQKFVRGVLALVAEYRRKADARLTKRTTLAKQEAGRRMSHILTYGWKSDPNSSLVSKKSGKPAGIMKCPKEQEIIQVILDLHAEGLGSGQIKAELEHKGIWYRGGRKSWSARTIRNIIKREVSRNADDSPRTVPAAPAG